MLPFPMVVVSRHEQAALLRELCDLSVRIPVPISSAASANRSPVSPFFATLTDNSQPIENPTTLSPAFATLTRFVEPNPCVCHSYKKQGGWGVSRFPSSPRSHPLHYLWPPTAHTRTPATPFLSCAYFTALCIPGVGVGRDFPLRQKPIRNIQVLPCRSSLLGMRL
jgi:hypothetical protein